MKKHPSCMTQLASFRALALGHFYRYTRSDQDGSMAPGRLSAAELIRSPHARVRR